MSTWSLRAAAAAAFALLGCGACAHSALADVVVLRTGEVIPKNAELDSSGFPTPQAIEASANTPVTEYSYDVVKIGGREVSAGLVAAVGFTALNKNATYAQGMIRVDSAFWVEAAESFGRSAEELKGPPKQEALFKRVLCLANANDLDGTLQAADDLLKEFPKSFYFGPSQQKRALVFASNGKMDDAVAALKAVTDAPGMNFHDSFEAQYTDVWLTKMSTATSMDQVVEAEKAFKAIADAIDANPKAKLEAADQRMKALARVGKCLALENKADQAQKLLEPLIAGADRNADKSALAAAYAGLGDALFKQTKAVVDSGKKDQAKEICTNALLAYLRVAWLYADSAERSDLFNATQNSARLCRNLFALSGDKDCDYASRAYQFYRRAVDMLDPNSPERRQLVSEGRALDDAFKKAGCAGGEDTSAPPAPSGGGNDSETPPK